MSYTTCSSAVLDTDIDESVGFVEEMRFAAMKLHTREQAPKEGSRPETENPTPKVRPPPARMTLCRATPSARHVLTVLAQASTPTHEGYLQFLAESKKVYDTLEHIVEEASHPECKTCCLHLAVNAPHMVRQ